MKSGLRRREDPRRLSPVLHQEIHGHPLVFLDSAASAQKPTQVIEAQADVLRHSYANIHRGVYTLSERATDLHDAAREKVPSVSKCRRASAKSYSRAM